MSAINILSLTRDSSTAKTTTQASATMTLTASGQDEKLVLQVTNNATASATIVIESGTGFREDVGDLTVTVASGAATYIGPLDSMRFKDLSTGAINVSVWGSSAGVTFPATIGSIAMCGVKLP